MKQFKLKESEIKVSPFNQFMNILNDKIDYEKLHIFEVKTMEKTYTVEYSKDYDGYTDKNGYNYKLIVLGIVKH
ncbi:hypothetical protein [Methanobrevibacter arboriphilus]|uniref:Uncharacterized protein n=2 Tax=Methanobrevibacter arboriphilus TaxID=39441 RepID=A0ACA8R4R6_METAZ|nr:hypothetical protein [Methanobrevibacter arboriphilus]BBL62388.1 hypothetical protein MarbSA_14280 [Methanobrevibacter arboriphilus]